MNIGQMSDAVGGHLLEGVLDGFFELAHDDVRVHEVTHQHAGRLLAVAGNAAVHVDDREYTENGLPVIADDRQSSSRLVDDTRGRRQCHVRGNRDDLAWLGFERIANEHFIRHSPDAIQIRGNHTTGPPPGELHIICSHPMGRF